MIALKLLVIGNDLKKKQYNVIEFKKEIRSVLGS